MKNIIEKIKKIVWDETYYKEDYYYHFIPVVKYSLLLAKKYKVKDKELVEIAAWLHDIGRLPKIGKKLQKENEHHIIGARKAEKILKKLCYPAGKIENVKRIVLAHRGHYSEFLPKTIEEKIIANADAMSHFEVLPLLVFWRTIRGFSFEDTLDWIKGKMERGWKIKITLPEAKKMVRKKYLRNMEIIKELKDLRK
jgi:uncharacterized protein